MYAVVRIRGTANIIPPIAKTLELLGLRKCNHCILVQENHEIKGMLRKAKDYVTWGEINSENLVKLIKYRMRLNGNIKMDIETIKNVGFNSFEELSTALIENKITIRVLKKKLNIKHVIRLHPPRKGYEGVKRAYRAGGALGYRGSDINKLITRMIFFDEQKNHPDEKRTHKLKKTNVGVSDN